MVPQSGISQNSTLTSDLSLLSVNPPSNYDPMEEEEYDENQKFDEFWGNDEDKEDESETPALKKARLRLKSVTRTNPKEPLGWRSAARLEKIAGKAQAARRLIWRGCQECPTSEDVWFEASTFAVSNSVSKAVIAKGLKVIPNSVMLWMKAAKLEEEDVNKIRVLRKAMEYIPDSVTIRDALAELCNEEDGSLSQFENRIIQPKTSTVEL